MKYIIHITLIALITLIFSPLPVHAEELTISGNGSDSTSQITQTSPTTQAIQSTNNATVTNDVQVSFNTGNNAANGNTPHQSVQGSASGNTTITTGDTTTVVDITNTANNATVNTITCCPTAVIPPLSGGIQENGVGSTNQITQISPITQTIQSNNTTTITNYISGTANTGNNHSSNNTGGNVSINTGSITVVQTLTSGSINVASFTVPSVIPANAGIHATISGNGVFSDNQITQVSPITLITQTNNDADIMNNILWDINTGDNKASENTNGDVSIATGSIKFLTDILNGPINMSEVEADCQCNKVEKPKEQPVGNPPPVTTTTSSPSSPSNPSTPSVGGGRVLGISIGKILPVTGNYSFFLLMIGNVALFFLGFVLRLRSGNSPGGVAEVVA